MCDFLYTSKKKSSSKLKECFSRVYDEEIEFSVFSSENCTLALSENIYNGFKSYKVDNYICAVIGGPVLKFRKIESRSQIQPQRSRIVPDCSKMKQVVDQLFND